MSQNSPDPTRVMPAGAPIDRTLVAGAAFTPPPPAGATQMGVTVSCGVCRTVNTGLETYCTECGFLLSSVPGEEAVPEVDSGPALELVETSSGRTFKLRAGDNSVGRENCDILLLDGTVSRRHAVIKVSDAGTVEIVDLGSTNGTFVEGSRLAPNTPTTLGPGGSLKFGNAVLALGGAPPPADRTILATAVVEPTLAVTAAPVPEPEAAASLDASQEEAEAPFYRLRPTEGPGAEIPISMGTVTIGRRAGNSVVITGDQYISGHHADLIASDAGCYLVDVGSTNGTLVNGDKLEANVRQLLLDGDEVGLGQSTYLFETVDAPEPDGANQEASEAETEVEGEQVESSEAPVSGV